MTLALICVLGAIFATLWGMKRLQSRAMGDAAAVRVVSGVMVGQKERVVVVEVQDTWLVLGVTSSEVGLLHSLPKPASSPERETIQLTVPFSQRLSLAIRQMQKRESEEVEP
ncbi:flagellar biosynthetic protein FliO [Burkholderiaceae bacterium DAT-1]|nr:flagellar biosynthetic protein FliO [Burkholderiaceae bacterium DAT-1]